MGAPAQVRIDALPGEWFQGAVEMVGRSLEFTPRFLFSEKERPNLVVRVRVAITPITDAASFMAWSSKDLRGQFLKELGLPESGLDRLIKETYHTLGLLSFLTTGPDETRAWTCHIGDLAPRASRAIHTDFERLFIRAEVINWQDLLTCGGYGPARAKGLLHTVGKDYVVKDGDVVEILIGK